MKMKMPILFLIAVIFLSACAQEPGADLSTPFATEPGTDKAAPTAEATTPTHIRVDLSPSELAASQSLSQKYNIPIDKIIFVSTEAVTWPNGCLGVESPGVMCTQVLVDGFRIIMNADDKQYEFHTNQDGSEVVDATQSFGQVMVTPVPVVSPVQFVVYSADGKVEIVKPGLIMEPSSNPSFSGLLPTGGAISGTAYVFISNEFKAVAIDTSGVRDLSFIKQPTYGLALWRGGPDTSPMLAWGTQLVDNEHPSTLQISAPDGSLLETIYTQDAGTNPPMAIVAEYWSADGKEVYFSKEPVGIGGYIPFSGASNLYKIDIASKQVTEIIPPNPDTGTQTCLDAISGDYRLVADHCAQGVITIRDLQNGSAAIIQSPADVTGYRLLGSARFSPDGSQVGFALAEGNPDSEHGWVAVGSSAGGEAKSILEGDAGSYYTVVGWLDDHTLLLQLNKMVCTSVACPNELYTIGDDGSNLTKVADGSFLTEMDNR